MSSNTAADLMPFYEVIKKEIRKLMCFKGSRDWPWASGVIASHFRVLAASEMSVEAAHAIAHEFEEQVGSLSNIRIWANESGTLIISPRDSALRSFTCLLARK